MDSLCLKILELDGLTLVEHEHSDGEADMDEQVSLFFANTSGGNFPELFLYPENYWLDYELQDKSFFMWFCHNSATWLWMSEPLAIYLHASGCFIELCHKR